MANKSKRIKNNFRLYTSSVSKKKGEVYKVMFIPNEYNDMLWKQIELSEPSDIVTIRSEEESLNLLEKWSVIDDKNFYIPADIFLEGTVPIYDFVFEYKPPEGPIFYFCPTYRFIVFKEYEKQFNEHEKIKSVLLGVVIANFEFNSKNVQLANTFSIVKKTGAIQNEPYIGYRGINLDGLNKIPSDMFNFLMDSFQSVLIDWYSIQHALLNPVIKEQIRNRRLEPDKEDEIVEYRYKKNKQVAYIKRIPIVIEDLIEGYTKKYERHTDKWSVLGHWRTYKSGKKSWIKPHEKGPKRGQKLDNQEIRERKIVTE